MRRRTVVVLTLLNATILVASLAFYLSSRKIPPPDQRNVPSPAGQKAQSSWRAAVTNFITTNIVVRTNAFHWSQIESPDYRKYVSNLRAIGCPELTIKDIILTDVMKAFAEKRGKFYHNGRDLNYWETDEKRLLTQKQLTDREKQLAEIDKDVPAILRELLGINYERELNKYFVDTQEDERRLAFLAPEKSQRILELRDVFEGQKELIQANYQNPEELARKLAEVRQREEQELKSLLTPQEFLNYQLRTSETANWLRKRLVGFNPTEEEFRSIFLEAQRQGEFAALSVDQTNPETVSKLDALIKNVVNPSRVVDFEKTGDAEYQNLSRLAARFELSGKLVEDVASIKTIVEQEKGNLLRLRLYTQSERAKMLEEIQRETEKTLIEALGPEAYAVYVQESGQWLKTLPQDPVSVQEKALILAPDISEPDLQ